jgi:biotin carboxyl carrier protein
MKLRITVHGVAYEVDVEVLDAGEGFPARPLPAPARPAGGAVPAAQPAAPPGATPSGVPPAGAVASPIAGTVLEIRCRVGERVEKDQILLVLEAMKMKTSIAAPLGGRIARLAVAAGDPVREGETLVELE